MAGGQERALRRRIRSVQATRKTTHAMELIAGSRIMRAQARIAAARPYVDGLEHLASDLGASPEAANHRFVGQPDPQAPAGVVVVAGDRGLSGPYNVSVLRAAEAVVSENSAQGRQSLLMAVGRKAHGYLRFRGYRIEAIFTGITERPEWADVQGIAAGLMEAFDEGRIGSAEVVSTRFVSIGVQKVERRRLFPIEPGASRGFDYVTEPETGPLLEMLGPRLVEARLFLALLEASAAEYAARQRAMKAATDNADELVRNLRRVMNRARQDSITTEIMDIVGGAEALRATEKGRLPALPRLGGGTDGGAPS